MGEAQRRRAAAYREGPWPGGPARCPACLGTEVLCWDAPRELTFFGHKLATCRCGTTWEPIDETLISDRDDPFCSTSAPCDNCAFRPGALEQRDAEGWKTLIAKLRAGARFHCHKGVPVDPESEEGFAYPADRRELRLCRGYLDAFRRWSPGLGDAEAAR